MTFGAAQSDAEQLDPEHRQAHVKIGGQVTPHLWNLSDGETQCQRIDRHGINTELNFRQSVDVDVEGVGNAGDRHRTDRPQ